MTLQDVSYIDDGFKRVDVLGVVLCKDVAFESGRAELERSDSHGEARRVDI
jgi:hypothetical protein